MNKQEQALQKAWFSSLNEDEQRLYTIIRKAVTDGFQQNIKLTNSLGNYYTAPIISHDTSDKQKESSYTEVNTNAIYYATPTNPNKEA